MESLFRACVVIMSALLAVLLPLIELPRKKASSNPVQLPLLHAAILDRGVFFSPAEHERFVRRQRSERHWFGRPAQKRLHKRIRLGRTVLQQRSGRKRLYDHNLFLRALFQDRIVHNERGLLGKVFRGAVFVDIGSAILFREGAPTVRDLYEDSQIRPQLSVILATDINDRSSAKTRYMDIYRKRNRPLPFPVREIPMLIVHPAQVRKLTRGLLKQPTTPLIFRATSSGPDLYYTPEQAERHLAAVLAAHHRRAVLYLFNKFILLKHADRERFEIFGEIDARVGLWHMGPVWERVNWKRRSLHRAFRPNRDYARIIAPGRK